MASSDSAYIDEEVYSRESTDLDGIAQATARERVLGWHSFLDLVWKARVPIIPPSELDGEGSGRLLGRGATMVVSEHVWETPQRRAGGGDQKQPPVVAVKRLIVRFADSDDGLHARPQHELALLANFALELRALCHGALRGHANVVRLLGITWAEKGLPALVVERASAHCPTIQSLIESRKLRGVQKADILAGIVDGLAVINSLSLVHGDLKPANILIVEQGTNIVPKLSDFAFSRSWREPLPSGGTEYWNAPEYCEFSTRKYHGSNIPPRCRDLFSLGLVFWYVLNEKLPFEDIGEEADSSNQTRRKITAAKESGHLLGQLEADCKRYVGFAHLVEEISLTRLI
ncbi:kinase-like domain-containing protein [Thelonectria olida]|uniref:Kinase-like domain-containing protein n=1 Tax=Thelonectria olida TaxID=1576542 RepID=A0A9P8VSA6_9HYPO|nr:kinase-like domain-containing protein [Thelonectria olida]